MNRKYTKQTDLPWMHRIQDRRLFLSASAVGLTAFTLGGCARASSRESADSSVSSQNMSSSEEISAVSAEPESSLGTFVEGEIEYIDFIVDDVLEHPVWGDIHFSMNVPESYDGSEPFALYVHCPGVEGFYQEGVGAQLVEDFPFIANEYIEDMIVITPQFDDFGETSANQAIALTEWAKDYFNIDESRMFLSGFSYGGETISRVMEMRPDLFHRVLQIASQWDGDINALRETMPAIRICIGDNDEFYSLEQAEETYNQIRSLYEESGLSEDEVDDLVKLDVFYEDEYEDPDNEHDETSSLIIFDYGILGWFFDVFE